jgi:Phage integrase, N-terminal SAM-like domain
MKLAGLSPRTQKLYISAVCEFANRYNLPPNQITEENVRAYPKLTPPDQRGSDRRLRKSASFTSLVLMWNTSQS